MKTFSPNFRVHYLIAFGILILSGYLIFKNLGDATFWCDEAVTAVIGKNLAHTGHTTAWDGRNMISGGDGSYLHPNLDVRDPPAMFVLPALSFMAFGVNTFTARLPFAILGLLTVILLYLLVRLELPDRPAMALYAAAFLGLFPEYILYVRSCRYFALACFGVLLTFFAYRSFIRHQTLKNSLFLAGSAALLFFSHYLIAAAFLISLALSHLLFERKRLPAGHWRLVIISAAAFMLIVMPHAIAGRVWEHPFVPGDNAASSRFQIVFLSLRDSLLTGVAPWSIVVLSVVLVFSRGCNPSVRQLMKQALVVILVQICFIGLTSQQFFSAHASAVVSANLRYLVGCFPFTALLAGGLLQWVHKRNKTGAVLLAGLITTTNISYFHPWPDSGYFVPHPLFYSPLYSYCAEIHRHYHTATEEVTAFLDKNARQDETFIAYPGYRDASLQFCLGSRLINCALFDSSNCLGAGRMRSISPYLLKNENFPDWIVFFGKLPSSADELRYFSRTITRSDGSRVNCEYEVAADLQVFGLETNRPEIDKHSFVEFPDSNWAAYVMIFHKVPGDTAGWLGHLRGIIGCAQRMNDPDIVTRNVQKLLTLYRQDSTVLRHFTPTGLSYILRVYSALLDDSKQFDEEKRVNDLIARFASQNNSSGRMNSGQTPR